jgi:anti-anti-sigma factor
MLDTHLDDGTLTVIFPDRLDTLNADEINKELMTHVSTGQLDFILDMGHLTYISSSGLRVLLILQKKVSPLNGQVSLANVAPDILQIIDISGFTSLFDII